MYHWHQPTGSLAQYIDQFWWYDQYVPSHTKERILPTGAVELVMHLRDDHMRIYAGDDTESCEETSHSLIQGPYSRNYCIDAADQSSIIGVHFKAGGAFPFFKIPMQRLHNMHVALDALWGNAATALREQVLSAMTPAGVFARLEDALRQQLTRGRILHPSVPFALQRIHTAPKPLSIANLAEQMGVSHRHFIHLFEESVGMPPKRYARIVRLQQSLHRIHQASALDWSAIALDCGYYDQAHFIHDFREFTSMSPTVYMAQPSSHINHVAVQE